MWWNQFTYNFRPEKDKEPEHETLSENVGPGAPEESAAKGLTEKILFARITCIIQGIFQLNLFKISVFLVLNLAFWFELELYY
ncbi:hypothetical protein Patl1_32394 [Pistacia atlantica]|uniref:Uncharacterized protein n=1 Tax=Pistacia atlantica TaxID=434234 RepID=A0ACC1AML8_9ROSI|nr:hypothetical protein Patl1_32394 [Pistacia atlantica]